MRLPRVRLRVIEPRVLLQGFPDAINQPKFPTTVIEPGQLYHHAIDYVFKIQ